MIKERIQKVLSQGGLGSRREIEGWIEQGLIEINGLKIQLGATAGPKDLISLRGKPITNPLTLKTNTRILLYHKPVGEISSRQDAKHSKTVFDNLPSIQRGRWVLVGRLDINSCGLLLFTNNGELANYLMHPKFECEREYAVRVHGVVTPEMIKILAKGVELEDGFAKFKKIVFKGGEGSNAWYHVVLSEGRNREVRRIWQSQGVEVSRLIRVRYGPFHLPRYLARGKSQELSPKEVEAMLAKLSFSSDLK